MKKYFLLLALIAAVSCVKDGLDDCNPVSGTYSLSLTATAPESSASTKTQIADDLSVSWSEEDKIKVCFPVNFDKQNTTGNTIYGVSGDFALSQQDGSKAVFSTDEWNVDLNTLMNGTEGRYVYNSFGYAFYPTAVEFSSSADNYSTGSYTCSYVIPSEQNAVAGSFDKNLNPAYAVIDRDELAAGNANVVFKNLAALVRINLGEGVDNVKEIQINTANKGASTVCGKMTLTFKGNDDPGVTAKPFNESSATPVCLRREDGEKLQAGETYYAVIAPGRTHVGLKLTFIGEEGEKLEKTVTIDGNWEVNPADCWTINVNNPIEYPEPTVLEVDQTAFELPYTEGEQTVIVTANYDWTASIPYYGWIRVKNVTDSGSDSFIIDIDENTDLFNSRSAEITVTSKEKTVTITVTQDCKRYYITEQVTRAEDIEEGLYVIQFAEDADYYWQVDYYAYPAKGYLPAPDQGFTADFVYQFETIDGYDAGSSWGSYGSAATRVIKSLMNGLYLDYYYWDFTLTSKFETEQGFYLPIIMGSNYEGATTYEIDFWDWWDVKPIYCNSDGYIYTSDDDDGPSKWYLYKVEAE